MIMADTTYAGQLNVPDMFTRMMPEPGRHGCGTRLVLRAGRGGNRQRAHFDGLPVEFIADAISTLGANVVDGFETYHVMNPYDDGISMDTFVDWLIEAGYPIIRVPGVRGLAGAVRDHAAGTAREAAQRVADPAAAQLPEARTPDQRVPRAGGSLPRGRAGRQDRAGQGHPAHLRTGDRQVRHRPGAARPALTGTPELPTSERPYLFARRWAFWCR